jgi:hypothetical protein
MNLNNVRNNDVEDAVNHDIEDVENVEEVFEEGMDDNLIMMKMLPNMAWRRLVWLLRIQLY